MKLVTWNINSIRARTEKLLTWIGNERPDVLCLQETKVEDSGFPIDALRMRGYDVVTYGQRSYNGVAICARTELGPLTDVVRGFSDGEPDEDARLIAATVGTTQRGPDGSVTRGAGIRVVCVYVPNGQDLTSDKFPFKLAWYRRLRRFLDRTQTTTDNVIVCGDMNVTADDRDVCDPVKWAGQIHCSADERAALGELIAFPLVDLFRKHNPDGGVYSWWDYRGVAFFKNQGLRIDYIFATQPVADRCTACTIDRNARKGQDASDHAPVIATID